MGNAFAFLTGFRKFTVMVAFMAIMVLFRVLDYVNGQEFAENLQLAVVAFMGTNLGEHLIQLGKDWVQGKLKEIKNDSEGS